MGELIAVGTGLEGGMGMLSALASVLVLGIYLLLQDGSGNDDDDSSPGGGLMQPVGSAA